MLLLTFPCTIFSYSIFFPFTPLSPNIFCLFLLILPPSLSTAVKRSTSGFEGPHLLLLHLLSPSLPSSFTLPSLLLVRIHLLQCAVSGWLCICSVMLSHSPATFQSLSPLTHTRSHAHAHALIYTHSLIPGLSGPFNFHRPVVLTSPPCSTPQQQCSLFTHTHTPTLQFDLPPITHLLFLFSVSLSGLLVML